MRDGAHPHFLGELAVPRGEEMEDRGLLVEEMRHRAHARFGAREPQHPCPEVGEPREQPGARLCVASARVGHGQALSRCQLSTSRSASSFDRP